MIEKISWSDHVKKEKVLPRVKGERSILHALGRRKTNWVGHILHRNRCLKHIIEREIEGQK
jgi:hypothetical protein